MNAEIAVMRTAIAPMAAGSSINMRACGSREHPGCLLNAPFRTALIWLSAWLAMDRDYACAQLRVAPYHLAPQHCASIHALNLQRGNAISNEVVTICLMVLFYLQFHGPDLAVTLDCHDLSRFPPSGVRSILFARLAIIVPVKMATISRLAAIKRSCTGCSCCSAVGVIDAAIALRLGRLPGIGAAMAMPPAILPVIVAPIGSKTTGVPKNRTDSNDRSADPKHCEQPENGQGDSLGLH